MAAAFKTPVTSTQKLVLLALCDSANDIGECYPSVPHLVDKCSLSERTIQTAIVELAALGHLRRELRKGRSTVYWMTPNPSATPAAPAPHPRSSRTPANAAPPQQLHPTPATGAPPPPQLLHPTPAAPAPITINEPSSDPSGNHKTDAGGRKGAKPEVSAALLIAAGFPPEVAAEFIDHKRAMKAPLTERAWADHVREAEKAGWTPLAAAEKVMARGWKGFEAAYVGNKGAGGAPARQQSTAERNAEAKRLLGFGNKPAQGDFIDG
jgi:hypothetical protein